MSIKSTENKYRTNTIPTVSKFGLICTILFIANSIIGRLLFPFGDEPDFSVRAVSLVSGLEELPFWSPYTIFSYFYGQLSTDTACVVNASTFSFWASIDSTSCSESLEQITIRLLLMLIIISPLLYIIIFPKSLFKITSLIKIDVSISELKHRIDSIAISLSIPSIIYYLGLISHEQFSLFLSFFIFIFWDSVLLLIIFFSLIFIIDQGNSMIVFMFISIGKTSNYLYFKYGKIYFIIFMWMILLSGYIFGFSILELLPLDQLGLGQKSTALLSTFNDGSGVDTLNKYPVLLRPIITFMEFIILTPSFIKVIAAYLLGGAWLLLLIRGLNKKKINVLLKKRENLVISTLVTIIFFTISFPAYANGKYYAFMLPFIISLSLNIYSKTTVLFAISALNIIIFIHLILYRIS